jgi:pyruvate-formate lyase-activating enzyme
MKRDYPRLVASDGCGRLFEIPGLLAAGRLGLGPAHPSMTSWIPVPPGSALMELPGRAPVGFDPKQNRFVAVPSFQGKSVIAAAAFAAPAHAQLYTSMYETRPGAPRLPLFAYSPLGWKNGKFWTTVVRMDDDVRHDPDRFDAKAVAAGADAALGRFPGNRLVDHLVARCVREYKCPNAMNFALGRWECPVPVSPACNAGCAGCISAQKGSGVRSSQDRIAFTPRAGEILEYVVPHLETADRAMASFGQGCEGEPLLKAALIEKALTGIRKKTGRGTLHLNTNASDPDAVERLFKAGLDSIRVSLNSGRPEYYAKYYRTRTYSFEDVLESLERARRAGAYISLNYLMFPGFVDDVEETERLVEIVEEHRVNCIQMRCLNMDPEWYAEILGLDRNPGSPAGIPKWLRAVRSRAPWVRFGSFNPPKEDWRPDWRSPEIRPGRGKGR